MSPLDIMGFCFAAVLLAVALPWVFSRRKAEGLIIRDFEDIPDAHRYRDGGSFGFAGPADHTLGSGKPPARSVGRHPALDASYGKKRFTLTPRALERVNTQRKLAGRAPLNQRGFANAIAHPWDRWEHPRYRSESEWLQYLILYEVLYAEHQSPTVSCDAYIVIDESAPYNGQGGEYAGAGASGDWGRPGDLSPASAPETGSYQPGDTVGGYAASMALSDPNSFKGPDEPRNVADPGPQSNAYDSPKSDAPSSPDYGTGSSPSPSSDSSSSYSSSSDSSSSSSDSSSSSSSDSGSSSGGGGD